MVLLPPETACSTGGSSRTASLLAAPEPTDAGTASAANEPASSNEVRMTGRKKKDLPRSGRRLRKPGQRVHTHFAGVHTANLVPGASGLTVTAGA